MVKLYWLAADQGYALAQNNFGRIYAEGTDVLKLQEERGSGMGGAAARQTLHLAGKSKDRLLVMGAANGLKTGGQTGGS